MGDDDTKSPNTITVKNTKGIDVFRRGCLLSTASFGLVVDTEKEIDNWYKLIEDSLKRQSSDTSLYEIFRRGCLLATASFGIALKENQISQMWLLYKSHPEYNLPVEDEKDSTAPPSPILTFSIGKHKKNSRSDSPQPEITKKQKKQKLRFPVVCSKCHDLIGSDERSGFCSCVSQPQTMCDGCGRCYNGLAQCTCLRSSGSETNENTDPTVVEQLSQLTQ